MLYEYGPYCCCYFSTQQNQRSIFVGILHRILPLHHYWDLQTNMLSSVLTRRFLTGSCQATTTTAATATTIAAATRRTMHRGVRSSTKPQSHMQSHLQMQIQRSLAVEPSFFRRRPLPSQWRYVSSFSATTTAARAACMTRRRCAIHTSSCCFKDQQDQHRHVNAPSSIFLKESQKTCALKAADTPATTSLDSKEPTTTRTTTNVEEPVVGTHIFGKEPPRHELNVYYFVHYAQCNKAVLKDTDFQRENQWDEHGSYCWTASLTCPETGTVYRSGSLHDAPERWYDATGKVYYRKSKLAQQAASARAIDRIQWLGDSSEIHHNSNDRLCLEDPTILNSTLDPKTVQTLLEDNPSIRMIQQPHPEEEEEEEEDDDESGSSVGNNNTNSKERDTSYDDDGSGESNENGMADTFVKSGAEYIYTPEPTIQPPLVGLTTYYDPTEDSDDDIDNTEDQEYTMQHIQGSGASMAATIRNRDVPQQQQQQQQSQTTFERVMEAWAESRSTPTNLQQQQQPPEGQHSRSRLQLLPMRTNPGNKQKEVVADAVAWYNSIMDDSAERNRRRPPPGTRRKIHFQTTQGVQLLSVAASNAILSALAHANHQHSSVVPSAGAGTKDSSNGSTQRRHQQEQEQNIEDMAKQILDLLWKKSADDGDNGRHQQSPNAETYNAYLGCLAGPTTQRVAQRAEQILLSMMQGKVHPNYENQVLPKPTIETFNTVIRLWGRVGGEKGYLKMAHLYTKHLEPKPHAGLDQPQGQYWEPNRETFLSILSLHANGLVGGDVDSCPTNFDVDRATDWISKMQQLFDQKQHTNEKGDKNDDNNGYTENINALQPDTEVYNAPLRWSSGWDRPLYSRHIPWDSHDVIFHDGFCNPFSTDDSDTKSNNSDHKLVAEAKRIEEWITSMEERDKKDISVISQHNSAPSAAASVGPDIQTFESVIQAWVRTGTLDGLLQAESWAHRVIAASTADGDGSTRHPRLQTFHPIVAAWAHAGDERSPRKVLEWIDKLEQLSRDQPDTHTLPEVMPDGRVYASVVMAWKHYQEFLIRTAGTKQNASDSLPAVTEAAQECGSYLAKLCESLRRNSLDTVDGQPFFLEGSAFSDSVEAWGNVAKNSLLGKVDAQEEAITQMFETIKMLKDTIRFLISVENEKQEKEEEEASSDDEDSDGDDLQETELLKEWRSRQIRHLIQHTPDVFAKCVSVLVEIDAALSEKSKFSIKGADSEDGSFSRYIYHIEKMMRELEEFECYSQQGSDQTSGAGDFEVFDENIINQPVEDYTIIYEDLYSYHSQGCTVADPLKSKLSFYLQIVAGCSSLPKDYEIGDAVRLCMLSLEFLKRRPSSDFSHHSADLMDLYCSIVSVLGRKITNAKEREMILGHVSDHMKSLDYAMEPEQGNPNSFMDKQNKIVSAMVNAVGDGKHEKGKIGLQLAESIGLTGSESAGTKRRTRTKRKRRAKKCSS